MAITKSVTKTRIDKLSHSDTVLYEIHMLRFTCDRLIESEWKNERDAWVYLESFLVHYRNLVEFLSKPQSKIRDKGPIQDIHITNIWELEHQAVPSWVSEVHTKAQPLWAKYGEAADERISIYLQHSTTKRIDIKHWRIDEMVNEIEPLLTEITNALKPTNTLLEALRPVLILEPHSASTAVATATSTIMPRPGNHTL
jgi:hypothetical protein